LDGVSLCPAAGAHGEFTGMKVIHQYFKKHNDPRTKVLIRTRRTAQPGLQRPVRIQGR